MRGLKQLSPNFWPNFRPNFWRALGVALGIVGFAGCTSLGYYQQAIVGHLQLMHARRPVLEVIADPATPAALRAKLEIAQAARIWASASLGLPDNASYTHYAALRQRYVVWNVFAAPPLSLTLKESCFLFVGCLSYRGYFAEAAARAAGIALRAAGYDVFVGGVAAYSTLGWFADPLVSSMLQWENALVVKTVFHELAHQQLYIPDDSAFNESFATAVAEAGFTRWRAETALGAAVAPATAHDDDFIALLLRYRATLQQLYASHLSEPDKLAEKARTVTALRREFGRLKRTWRGGEKYAAWMAEDLNNAKLASIETYHVHVPAFLAILRMMQGDFPRFYRVVSALAKQSQISRDACLADIAATVEKIPASCQTAFLETGAGSAITQAARF